MLNFIECSTYTWLSCYIYLLKKKLSILLSRLRLRELALFTSNTKWCIDSNYSLMDVFHIRKPLCSLAQFKMAGRLHLAQAKE